jgi:poly-gamma-glutamate synthesis protein (capsule biosynthesis protein)
LNTTTVEPAPTATVTLQPGPTSTPSLWVSPDVPAELIQSLKLPDGISQVKQAESASLRLEVSDQNPVSRWVYAVVAPFSTITDTVRFDQVLGTWQGKSTGPFSGQPLLMDQETEQVLAALWNAPAPQGIKVMSTDQLVDYAWAHQPSWAIVPFEKLAPRWKVLLVDGESPVRKDFNLQAYTLSVPLSLNGDPGLVYDFNLGLPASNRDPNLLTTLVMTGVTALVRGTSNTMYFHGVDYPAEDIAPILQGADITHISNEVPFSPDCPLYNNTQDDLRFCTNPKYIGLLEYVGTKIVELTGDHFADNGPEAMLYTLQLYRDRGWPYYGGGANLEEGRQPAYIVHNGNRLAFIGCNAKRGGYATASATNPGAVPCDLDWMKSEVKMLRDQGYLPIVTYQHQEYYSYKVAPQYRPDFTEMADAGAVIVSGSQAHQPQNFEFDNGGLIHYGLGNLFFDQVDYAPETKDAFIDRHVFYSGRYISTELVTIRFVDMARSRLMTPDERARFLRVIFKASGW